MDDDKVFDVEMDAEEREILEAFERGETVPVPDMEDKITEYQEAARVFLRKEQRVNIRITNQDLFALKEMAFEDGIPYQTLMSSILHKYVTGRLIERPRTFAGQAEYALHEERPPYDDPSDQSTP